MNNLLLRIDVERLDAEIQPTMENNKKEAGQIFEQKISPSLIVGKWQCDSGLPVLAV